MSLLPSKPNLTTDAEPRVVGVDSEDADALMSALSSATARRLLSELHDEPAPPAELSNRADTTLQNTQYHLSNLEDAGAVEVVGTAYSEKGREMDVYAPADQPLVIFAGQEQQASGIRAALSRLLGAVGALLVGSLAVQQVFGDGLLGVGGLGASGGADGGYDAGGAGSDGGGPAGSTATETPVNTATAADGVGGGESATATAEPTPTQPPADSGTATATSDGPGIFTNGDATETATRTVADTVAATSEPATSTPTAAATPTPAPEPTTTVQAASDGGIEVVGSLPPGLLFFLGGLTVLVVGIVLTSRM